MLFALGSDFARLSPCKKHSQAQEGGCRQDTPEGEIAAVLGLWNLVQRTSRCNDRRRLRRCRSGLLCGVGKSRYAVVGLSILFVGHAGRIIIGAGHGDGYFVGNCIIVDILVIARLLREVVDIGAGFVERQSIKGDISTLIVLHLQPLAVGIIQEEGKAAARRNQAIHGLCGRQRHTGGLRGMAAASAAIAARTSTRTTGAAGAALIVFKGCCGSAARLDGACCVGLGNGIAAVVAFLYCIRHS